MNTSADPLSNHVSEKQSAVRELEEEKRMGDLNHYIIRGGIEGRERLRLLSRVMQASTSALFERLGVSAGSMCLDVGCGGGDVTLDLARRVALDGKVVGVDLDGVTIGVARREAAALGIGNVEFRVRDIREQRANSEFDVVYARFLLTHLPDPASAVAAFFEALKPGGLVIIEDIDCSGSLVSPESPAFWRFHELYCEAVRRRGGDPNIGPRLPLMLKDAGFAKVDLSVVQPSGLEGEAKLLVPLTMEGIADSVVREGLASAEEIADVVAELYDFAANPRTISGIPRVIQTWGRRPTHAESSRHSIN